MTEEQRKYIFQFLVNRQEKITTRLNANHEIRKREGDINPRRKYQERKDLAEMSLIHSIMHELFADDYNQDL